MPAENVPKRNGKMKKYVCVFCDERKSACTARIINAKIGICSDCYDSLDKTAPALPYQGTKNISYIMSPFEYTGTMREAILDFKFKNCRSYAPLFADMMKEYLDSYDIWNEFDFIVPVPLHKSRLKERGYNQAELIAAHAAKYLSLPLESEVLARTRATERQSSLKRTDRVLNVKNAFKCEADLSGKSILLFDDITTTGSTLQACAAALADAGAKKICALTLAVHAYSELPVIMY